MCEVVHGTQTNTSATQTNTIATQTNTTTNSQTTGNAQWAECVHNRRYLESNHSEEC
jgi:hypothetical protein